MNINGISKENRVTDITKSLEKINYNLDDELGLHYSEVYSVTRLKIQKNPKITTFELSNEFAVTQPTIEGPLENSWICIKIVQMATPPADPPEQSLLRHRPLSSLDEIISYDEKRFYYGTSLQKIY